MTVTNGDPVILSVSATGTAPLVFQWQIDGNDLTDETNATLNIAATVPSDAGDYSVVITNLAGLVTSQAATLTVLDPPAITTQPVSLTA